MSSLDISNEEVPATEVETELNKPVDDVAVDDVAVDDVAVDDVAVDDVAVDDVAVDDVAETDVAVDDVAETDEIQKLKEEISNLNIKLDTLYLKINNSNKLKTLFNF
jgi:hypothetical protein